MMSRDPVKGILYRLFERSLWHLQLFQWHVKLPWWEVQLRHELFFPNT
jgi:hypothetical protein